MVPFSARSKSWMFLIAFFLFIVYFCAAKLGLTLAVVNASATAVWAPTGIALASFLVFGEIFWPSVFLAAFAVNLSVDGSIPLSLAIAVGNTLEGLVGARLIRRFAQGRQVFDSASDILKFALLIEPLSAAISATTGVTSLCLGGQAAWNAYGGVWLTWWTGDLAGALIFTPLIVLWANRPQLALNKVPLLLTALVLVGFTGQAISGGWFFPLGTSAPPLQFLCVPPLIWIAFRLGTREISAGSLVMTLVILWNTLHGMGPFVHGSLNESLLFLQAFMGVLAMTSLTLASAVQEKKAVEEKLLEAKTTEKGLKEILDTIQLFQSITVVANESRNLAEAVQISLAVICRTIGWPVGHVYYPDPTDPHRLKPGAQWFIRNPERYANLRKVTENRYFEAGEMLPGRVFSTGESQWIEDTDREDRFLRARSGLDVQVRATFGIPIKAGKQVVAVLEFFNDIPSAKDPDLLENLQFIGTQLGRVVERQKADESQAQLALLVETSSDFIVTTNPEGYLTYLNKAGRAMVGLEPNFNIGVLRHEDFVFPDDVPKLREEVLGALMSKGHWEGEFHLKNFKTGEAVPIYFSAGILVDPLTGQPQTLAAIGHDVTDIKRAEAERQKQATLLQSIVNNMGEGLLVCDTRGKTVFANPAATHILGGQLGDPIPSGAETKNRVYEATSPNLLGPEDFPIVKALGGVPTDDVELFIKNRTKPQGLYVAVTSRPLRDPENKVTGAISVFRDITERRKMDELLRSNTELQQFANVASHDLQEPLRMVASYIQLLESRFDGRLDDETREFMSYAVEGAKRMQSLVNGLLEYARVESQGKPLQRTDMNVIFDQTLSNLEMRITETGAQITRGDLPWVMGDPVQLVQLMQNLISNALKFQKPGIPRVSVTAEEKGGEWIFACKDNGIGIDPKYFDRIFLIFQRLHRREEYTGMGIGLAVCKRIVERHGGRIWVESKPQEGSTFFFTMPQKDL